MSGPADGKYHIQLATGVRPRIGVDDVGAHVTPVIAEGRDDVWIVKKSEDGKYRLFIEGSGRRLFIQVNEGKVVASDRLPPSAWDIGKEDGGFYGIAVPEGVWPANYWTLNKPAPKSPVTLIRRDWPVGDQLWNFIPVHYEE